MDNVAQILKMKLIDEHYISVMADCTGPCYLNAINGKKISMTARTMELPPRLATDNDYSFADKIIEAINPKEYSHFALYMYLPEKNKIRFVATSDEGL